jgi:hypothetical protein
MNRVEQSGLAAELDAFAHDPSHRPISDLDFTRVLSDLGLKAEQPNFWAGQGSSLVVVDRRRSPGEVDDIIRQCEGANPRWLAILSSKAVKLHPLSQPRATAERPRALTFIRFDRINPDVSLISSLLGDEWAIAQKKAAIAQGLAEKAFLASIHDAICSRWADLDWDTVRRAVDSSLLTGFKAWHANALGIGERPASVADCQLEGVPWNFLSPTLISRIHEQLVEPSFVLNGASRKQSGAYFTPPHVVDHVAATALAGAVETATNPRSLRIIDPSMGSGAFLISAAQTVAREVSSRSTRSAQWRELGVLRMVIENSIYGVDSDPITVDLARNLLTALVHEPGRADVLPSGVRQGDSLQPHEVWEKRFPEVFDRPRPGFDAVIGNPPWEELTVEQDSFWAKKIPAYRRLTPGERSDAEESIKRKRPDLARELEDLRSTAATRREALITSGFPVSRGDSDLYKAFSQLFLQLKRTGGSIGIVLPRSAMTSLGSAGWRKDLFEGSSVTTEFCRNDGGWMFPDVNHGYEVVLISAHDSPTADQAPLKIRAGIRSKAALQSRRSPLSVDADRLFNGDGTMCVPPLKTARDRDLYLLLSAVQQLGDSSRTDFRVRLIRELDATNDKDLFRPRGLPVYNHRNIGHASKEHAHSPFAYVDKHEAEQRLLSKRRSSSARTESPWFGLDPSYLDDPATLEYLSDRLAFRDVVHASNPRKLWASVVPAGVMLTNKAPYFYLQHGHPLALRYLMGVLASDVADWWVAHRMVLSLNFFILNSLPVPHFDHTDPLCLTLVNSPGSQRAEASLLRLLERDCERNRPFRANTLAA